MIKKIPNEVLHGGDLLAFSQRYHKREDEILDFSSNINPLGFPESLVRVYLNSLKELSRYPDPYAKPLCEKIADLFFLSPEHVIAGNGSLAMLELAIRALSPKRALLVEPCFGEYRRLLTLLKCNILSLPLAPEDQFKFSLQKIVEQLKRIDLLILGHPNNPTGTAFSKEEMGILLEEARRSNTFIIADEAFADWAPEISMVKETKRFNRFLIARSMTKFFALPGIRSGFALGSPELIGVMKSIQGPWACNRIAQKLSIAGLEDADFQKKTIEWFHEESIWLREAFENLGIFQVFPGLANFFLIRNTQTLVDFYESLGEKGIYIRSAGDFLGLNDFYFRTAIRTRTENQRLVEALSQWVYRSEKKEKGKPEPASFR